MKKTVIFEASRQIWKLYILLKVDFDMVNFAAFCCGLFRDFWHDVVFLNE